MTNKNIIDQFLLEKLTDEAKASVRLRKNYNFHTHESDQSQRLLNAVEPGSYIVPHRHLNSTKDETIVIVKGAIGLLLFDEKGNVTEKFHISPNGKYLGINIKCGTFHSLVALTSGTVFFESKAGPYEPLEFKEIAPWAPQEGSAEAAQYYLQLKNYFSDHP